MLSRRFASASCAPFSLVAALLTACGKQPDRADTPLASPAESAAPAIASAQPEDEAPDSNRGNLAQETLPPSSASDQADPSLSDVQPASRCTIGGWIIDPDPGGTNLRAGPGSNHEILDVIPQYSRTGEGLMGLRATSVDLVGARGGWFKVESVRDQAFDSAEQAKSYPDGWIHGSLIDFALQTEMAFARPDPQSTVVARNSEPNLRTPQWQYRRPRDCRGEWVEVEVETPSGAMKRAWARGVCPIYENHLRWDLWRRRLLADVCSRQRPRRSMVPPT